MNGASYNLLGRNALGYHFLIPSQFHYENYPYTSPLARNSFDIVAVTNATLVTIVPTKAIEGHAAGDTFSIVLNRGQTWEGRAISGMASEHIGGTVVWANKPVAVTISDDAVYVPISDVSVDLAGDQLIPTELCGTRYFHAGGGVQFRLQTGITFMHWKMLPLLIPMVVMLQPLIKVNITNI
jgi:hypothetical protein